MLNRVFCPSTVHLCSNWLGLDAHFLSRGLGPFGLSLSQYGIGCACSRLWCRSTRRWAILGHLSVAAGMIYAAADLGRVLPDPILYLLRPRRLKLLLADRAGGVAECRVVGGMNPWLGWSLLRSTAICPCGPFTSRLGISWVFIIRSLA